jgi:hypothetical protein
MEFYQHDTLLVDRYELPLGNPQAFIPFCQSGKLEIQEEKGRITLSGKEFRMKVNTSTGLMEDVIHGSDTLIKSGPYLNLRVPGSAVQYSTIEMDDLAKNWKCIRFSYSLEEGIATLKTEGRYDHAKASFTMRIDDKGIMEISYDAEVNSKKKNIQEVGIKFITGASFENLSWKRDPYFTAYPESHPGRAEGEARLSYRPESEYRKEPGHGWEQDTRGFYYYGLETKLPYTNEIRSLKENIFTYTLSTGSNAGLKVYSDGHQACRFDLVEGNNTLLINDQWDYFSLRWGNYMKLIPLNKEVDGKIFMELSNLSP